MISLALIAFMVSLVATLWVRRLFRRQACRYAADAPQRFHFGDTPRMGGLGMLAGWALALAALPLLQALHLAGNIDRPRLDLTLWLLMLLLFVGGVMNFAWIAGLALFVLVEKLAPAGHWTGRAAGAGLVLWGGATLATL